MLPITVTFNLSRFALLDREAYCGVRICLNSQLAGRASKHDNDYSCRSVQFWKLCP